MMTILSPVIISIVLTSVAARTYHRPDLKPGTFGYMEEGDILQIWNPDEFDKLRENNPFIELLVAIYPFVRPFPPATSSGSSSAGASPLGSSSLSQASSSVGAGSSVASAGVRPVILLPAGVSTVSADLSTSDPPSSSVTSELPVPVSSTGSPSQELIEASTSPSTSSTTEGRLNEESSTVAVISSSSSPSTSSESLLDTSSKSILPLIITESTYLDIKTETTSNDTSKKTVGEEKVDVSDKENEIELDVASVVDDKAKPSTTSTTTTLHPPTVLDNKESDRRPTDSRPGFSSATSAASASNQVHAEGSSLSESPGSSQGNTDSNSNSAAVVYGEFAGSVSISSSSSSG